ncbi:MAG TPA: DUF4339 domain-containing protein [Stellaceae bacterium]|nr:DUF4339 domain-containing protein [Stellaceae bacterium]
MIDGSTAKSNRSSSEKPRWYIVRAGERHGPLSNNAILALAENDAIDGGDLVWRPGLMEWIEAGKVPGLLTPPPLPEAADTPSEAGATGKRHRGAAKATETKPSATAAATEGVTIQKPLIAKMEAAAPKAPLDGPGAQALPNGDSIAATASSMPVVHDANAVAAAPVPEGAEDEKFRALRAKILNTFDRSLS